MGIKYNVATISVAAGRGDLTVDTKLAGSATFTNLEKRAGKVARILLAKRLERDECSWHSIVELNGADIVGQL